MSEFNLLSEFRRWSRAAINVFALSMLSLGVACASQPPPAETTTPPPPSTFKPEEFYAKMAETQQAISPESLEAINFPQKLIETVVELDYLGTGSMFLLEEESKAIGYLISSASHVVYPLSFQEKVTFRHPTRGSITLDRNQFGISLVPGFIAGDENQDLGLIFVPNDPSIADRLSKIWPPHQATLSLSNLEFGPTPNGTTVYSAGFPSDAYGNRKLTVSVDSVTNTDDNHMLLNGGMSTQGMSGALSCYTSENGELRCVGLIVSGPNYSTLSGVFPFSRIGEANLFALIQIAQADAESRPK